MATEASQPLKLSLEANADLSGQQYRFVAINSSGKAIAYTGTEAIIGVLQNKPTAAGHMAEIVVAGVTKLVASAAITTGDAIGASANGRAAADATGAAHARALSTAAAADEVLSALVITVPNL